MSPAQRSRREAAAGGGPPFGEKTAEDFEAAEDLKENAMMDRITHEGASFLFSLKGFCGLTDPSLNNPKKGHLRAPN